MSETQAAPSTAEMPDPFNGGSPTLTEYARYRDEGEVPERFKPAEVQPETEESAPSPDAEPEGESAAPEPKQEYKKRTEQRFRQLTDEVKTLKQQLEEARRPQPTQTAPSPVKPAQARNYQEWYDGFDAQKWVESYIAENPSSSYEKANAAMFNHMVDVRDRFRSNEESQKQQQREIESKADEARSRYDNFDEVIQPAGEILARDPEIPMIVKQMVGASDVLPDLVYVLGEDPAALAKFVRTAKTNPTEALRQIALTESLIREELEGSEKPSVTPAKQSTAAPKPPSPVSGGSSRAFDVTDESLSPDEWLRKRTEQIRRRKS